MANKRSLKKFINTNCLDLVFVTFLTDCMSKSEKPSELENIISEVEALRKHALSAASVSFDKTPKSFANRHEYNVAKEKYFKQAYAKFQEEYTQRMQAIIDKINAIQK